MMKEITGKSSEEENPKRTWRKPELQRLGKIQDIVQGGGGKLSIAGGDPGEGRKPPGGE